ncbi:hypothetical protein EPUL_003941 [Erysiphe pulchra]|uniref:Frequency clock protein n=1 Tax=Erysiphe pulchra TaxID=225359 RepID=A0A2S4PSP4_9PEZI|nr:hypothetical protein EPUL_003941 [Erysiphe pulchra]
MFATTQSEQAGCFVGQNEDQYREQHELNSVNSTQLLSDLAVILRDVQVPQPAPQLQESQEQASVSENRPFPHLSVENNSASENDSVTLDKWFDDFNAHPEKGASKYRDTGSPYFLQRNSTNSYRYSSEHAPLPELSYNRRGGGSDDYRSVIDDLTIENQRLRKKLRRYKKISNKKLEKDKLFEIKIHDVPPAKRRELETALRSFASSIDFSRCQLGSSKPSSLNQSLLPEEALNLKKKSTSTSTTNSQLEQSSYDSIMTSTLPTTINSELFTLRTEKSASIQSSFNPCEGQSYVQRPSNNQNGLLHKNGLRDMSDHQKKNLVVQRLEQIFTGEKGVIMGAPSQALVQEEDSKLTTDNELILTSGRIREAHMIPQENYNYTRPTGSLNDLDRKPNTYSSDETNSDGSFSDQRPTRPLELDPDRTQIPSDNVEYIRHLGLSTPQLADDSSENASKEGGGWVYLNLLINMAQLHIINVTPDFVRSAVVDVSEKFQLSKDGQMLRWKGGNQGTNLRSDENSCIRRGSDSSRNSDQDVYELKRKEKLASHHLISNSPTKPHYSSSGFHYRPLFIHQNSSEHTSESSESPLGSMQTSESNSSQNLWRCPRPRHQQSCSTSKKQFEDGSLVFYRGVDFCVDLCGDPETTSLQLSNSILEEDSGSEQNISSTSSDTPIERTNSGSLLPYRPFKNVSNLDLEVSGVLETSSNLSKSPSNSELELSKFPTESRQEPILSQPLQPCGIGGAQISDHFEIHVMTQHTVAHSSTSGNGSHVSKKFGIKNKSYFHNQSRNDIKAKPDEDYESDRLTSLVSRSPLLTLSCQKAPLLAHSQVQTRIVSSETIHLPPSKFPSPSLLEYSSDSDIELDYKDRLIER